MSYKIVRICKPNGPGPASDPWTEAANIASVVEAIALCQKWQSERYCLGRGPEAFNNFHVETQDGERVYPVKA